MDYWFAALLIALLLIVGYIVASIYINNKIIIEQEVLHATLKEKAARKDAAPLDNLQTYFPEAPLVEAPNDTPPSLCPAPRPEKRDLPVVNACPMFTLTSMSGRLSQV